MDSTTGMPLRFYLDLGFSRDSPVIAASIEALTLSRRCERLRPLAPRLSQLHESYAKLHVWHERLLNEQRHASSAPDDTAGDGASASANGAPEPRHVRRHEARQHAKHARAVHSCQARLLQEYLSLVAAQWRILCDVDKRHSQGLARSLVCDARHFSDIAAVLAGRQQVHELAQRCTARISDDERLCKERLKEGASDIRRAYHRMALALHPDKKGSILGPSQLQQFDRLVEAYEVLRNNDTRREYDATSNHRRWVAENAKSKARTDAKNDAATDASPSTATAPDLHRHPAVLLLGSGRPSQMAMPKTELVTKASAPRSVQRVAVSFPEAKLRQRSRMRSRVLLTWPPCPDALFIIVQVKLRDQDQDQEDDEQPQPQPQDFEDLVVLRDGSRSTSLILSRVERNVGFFVRLVAMNAIGRGEPSIPTLVYISGSGALDSLVNDGITPAIRFDRSSKAKRDQRTKKQLRKQRQRQQHDHQAAGGNDDEQAPTTTTTTDTAIIITSADTSASSEYDQETQHNLHTECDAILARAYEALVNRDPHLLEEAFGDYQRLQQDRRSVSSVNFANLCNKRGDSLLLFGAREHGCTPGTLRALVRLAGSGLDLDQRDSLGRSALIWSLINADLRKVRYLLAQAPLAHAFNINLQDEDGFAAVHFAVLLKDPQALQLLLATPALDINLACFDTYSSTALHLAASIGFLDGVKLLLQAGASLEPRRLSAAAAAAAANAPTLAEEAPSNLLRDSHDDLFDQQLVGESKANYSCLRDSTSSDSPFVTPLLLAISEEHMDVASYLVDYAIQSKTLNLLELELHSIALSEDLALLRKCLEAGVPVDTISVDSHEPCLALAYQLQNQDMIHMLEQEFHADTCLLPTHLLAAAPQPTVVHDDPNPLPPPTTVPEANEAPPSLPIGGPDVIALSKAAAKHTQQRRKSVVNEAHEQEVEHPRTLDYSLIELLPTELLLKVS